MTECMDFNLFTKHIREFRQSVEIDKQKDKPLRYNVWGTTSKHISDLFRKGRIDVLPQENNSRHINTKLENALRRISESTEQVPEFIADVIDDTHNVEFSIALHELMESVKGESDKARNIGIEVSQVSNDGILPALPLSRVAASIGRKIAYQKGYRFKSQDINPNTAAEIEQLYYAIGKIAIQGLEQKGYVDLHQDLDTIKDYITDVELNKDFPNTEKTAKVLSVSMNTKKLGIEAGTEQANYFLNRTTADIDNTKLGVVTDMLRAVRYITQPSTIVLPDTKNNQSEAELAENDVFDLDPGTAEARKKLYDNPLYVHNSLHSFMNLLSAEVNKTGKPASKIITERVGRKVGAVASLFGLKRSDDYSIDKKESVQGQNLSKTTPLDELADYYEAITENGDRSPLHMVLRVGRNGRLYYWNSLLNPHSSKQSRYMLTSGEYTVDVKSDDYDYLVYNIGQALDKNLTYDELTSGGNRNLEAALELYNGFEAATTLKEKLIKLRDLPGHFPGQDYVTLLTALRAVKDIRSSKNGKVTTEFSVSADATASGGTLTFMQALGTDPEIDTFMERIGLFNESGSINEPPLDDLYGLMSEAIVDFVDTGPGDNVQMILQDTLDMLFNQGKDVRELSKDPTMTFVYGQGRKGAIQTMSRSLADRIIDNLDDPKVRTYLSHLFGDPAYRKANAAVLRDTRGLYQNIVNQLVEEGLPGQLYDLMDVAITERYLENFKERSKQVFNLVKKLPANTKVKILPAAAILSGKKASNKGDLKKFGMPITKLYEVSSQVRNGDDTVLTRKEKLMKTVMDVATIHGIDAAQLYHSLKNIMGDTGAVVVHDDVRGSVDTVRAMEAEYAALTQRAISEYDVHQQVLESIAHYDPELAQSPEFLTLKKQIDEEVAVKQDLMKNRFNKDTDALIGDGDKFKAFKNESQQTDTETATPKSKPLMQQFAEDSPDIIGRFMNIVGRSRITTGDKNEFVPGQDTIILSGTDQGRGTGRQLDMRKTEDRNKQKELLEHEIVHAGTVAYIRKALNPVDPSVSPDARKDMGYFEKAITQLGRTIDSADPRTLESLSEETIDRIAYIRSRPSTETMLGEFVAIMTTEPETSADIYKMLAGSRTLEDRIKSFVARVQEFIRNLTDADFKKEIDVELLYGSLQRTLNNGMSDRENKAEEVQRYLKAYAAEYGAGPAPAVRKASVEYMNYAVSAMLTSRLERKGKTIVGNIDRIMRDRFPRYTDVANKLRGIYDGSEHLQQLMHTITGNDIDKLKKADILSTFAKVTSEHTEVMNQQLHEFHKAMKGLDDNEKDTASGFINKMPLHDYFVLASDLTTGAQIDQEVIRLEKELRKKQPASIRDVDDLVNWQVNGEITGKIYNLDARYPLEDSDFGADVRKLLALKSIQALGTKKFEKFLGNTDLVSLIKDHSVANRLSVIHNAGASQLRDSLVPEYYKEPFQLKAIEMEDFPMYQYGENTGWKVLRAPTKNSLGVVYRPTIDSTDIAGAFTDIKLSSTDIDVSGRKANYPGVLQTRNGHKLVLNHKEKQELGLIEDFSQGLVRGTAHSMAIQDSQVIRDALLKGDSYMVIKDSKAQDLKDIIQSENIDNPWFIKLQEGQDFNSLPAAVKAKYMPVGARASNVKKFNESVDLVRKDISHWLLGGHTKSLFQHPQMKWATRITKGLISGAKIGMVVLNPVKIAKDNVSNITYLSMMGVDPRFVAKNYHEISRDYSDYQELQRQIIQLKVKATANPESAKIKKQIKALQDRVKKNPVGDLADKGFINSLGSDLVTRNADTLAGFQADMHTALKYMLTDSKGNRNYVAHFIMQMQNLGFNGEDFLSYIGGIAGKFKSGKGMERELDQVVERLREIRSEGDVINYVSQYTTSPGSEAVRLGAGMTDLTDVLAKETLYRHLVQEESLSPDAAKIKVLDSFPDYKENMPMAVKQLSDMGIIMFPSFWLRIQKVIYRLGRDKPVNLATEIMLQEALDSDISTILDANIVNKANTFGGLLHTPLEPIGVGSVIPTHIF